MRDSISRYPLSQRHDLPGGGCLVTRRIKRDDKKHLQSGMKDLSLQSRRYRFLSPISELPETLLRHLTEVDYFNHDAWVALLLNPDNDKDFEPAGVGRYVRSEDDSERAELALLVVDALQGRGIGKILLKQLAKAAQSAGIGCFDGVVLGNNTPMLSFVRKLGGRKTSVEDGLVNVEFPLENILEA